MAALQQQQQPLIEQQLSQNPRFFYDLPPHEAASLQHMSPNDDPQRFYNVSAAEQFVPSPNQLYIFSASARCHMQSFASLIQTMRP